MGAHMWAHTQPIVFTEKPIWTGNMVNGAGRGGVPPGSPYGLAQPEPPHQGPLRPLPGARYALGDMHPELVTLRFKMLDGEVARMRSRMIAEAGRHG